MVGVDSADDLKGLLLRQGLAKTSARGLDGVRHTCFSLMNGQHCFRTFFFVMLRRTIRWISAAENAWFWLKPS
jgi:hypothetical protein